MAKPVCRVLIPETLEQAFLFVVALLDGLGLTLTNPDSSKITTWTDDGDQVEIATGKVLSEVLSGSLRNVQFWRSASEDVFVAWENAQGQCTFTIYLDGLDSAFAVALTAKFAESVLTKFRSDYVDGQAFAVEFE
ncbi:hypothetical protein FSB08_15835 [Paraburkholderia sp. JPY432]|uniref:hypothetical protein n=1 Tax=Paraburkholderia youngii TaxID=2782701 RepID=UPI001595140B|nr:hypothetical protein [Paraburkholderia youngii]NVH74001.1 hypothetical protein [Paraburkholderia youngii]